MVNLAEHIIKIDGKEYVPLHIAQELVLDATSAINTIITGRTDIDNLTEEIEND